MLPGCAAPIKVGAATLGVGSGEGAEPGAVVVGDGRGIDALEGGPILDREDGHGAAEALQLAGHFGPLRTAWTVTTASSQRRVRPNTEAPGERAGGCLRPGGTGGRRSAEV